MSGTEALLRIFSEADTPENGPYVVVEVRDTGVGMSPDVLEKVFEPFYTTKPVGKGTGLGLAITKKLADLHEGSVEVESEPGQGSSFRVVLPVR